MLIKIKDLVEKYDLKIKGVFHVGGSHAEELESYLDCGIENQIWIEAIPEIYKKMVERLKKYPKTIAINACVSDTTGQEVQFKVTSNEGQSSSILDLKEHLVSHPDVLLVEILDLETIRIKDILEERKISLKDYNFINMDIQGAELLALKGMGKHLSDVDYVYLEVNTKELYEGCAMLDEIDEYLKCFDFKRVETKIYEDLGWGDAFFIKN